MGVVTFHARFVHDGGKSAGRLKSPHTRSYAPFKRVSGGKPEAGVEDEVVFAPLADSPDRGFPDVCHRVGDEGLNIFAL